MKLLRIGKEGKEIPVALDKNGKYRNLSSIIKDLNPENINFEIGKRFFCIIHIAIFFVC